MSKTKKPTVSDCEGCRNDFYNYNRMGLNETAEGPRCWGLESAEFVKARDVPTNMSPPYKHIPLTVKPSCYKKNGYCRVKPEALDASGYWRALRIG